MFSEEEIALLDEIEFEAIECFHLDKFLSKVAKTRNEYIKENGERENDFTLSLFNLIIADASMVSMQAYFSLRHNGIKSLLA